MVKNVDKHNNLRKIPPEFWLVAIATAFCTYAELAYEVALTRIFSVMLTYHYVFAVISFSLFGLGLGAMLFKWWRKWFPKCDYRVNLSLFTISILVSVILIVKLPIYNNPSLIDFRLWIYIFLATLPFFFAGLVLAEVFQKFAQFSSILYGFDLFGGALGAITVVFLLNNFSAVNASLIIASIAAFGALIIGFSAKKMPVLNVIPIILLGLVLGFTLFSKINLEVPVAMDPNKDMYRMLNNPIGRAKIIESRWSAFGRTDVVYSSRYPDEMVLFVDGAAGSSMYKLDDFLPDSSKGYNLITRSFGEYFPFFFLKDSEKNSALIIGPGGGRDVVVALMGGVNAITAVEVNPDVVQIVKDYKDFNGGIYSGYPNVRVVTKEGRNYLRDEKTKYDLIMTSIPV
ncbi:MAG TPA: hypothetical protein ENH09_04320, partial [Bacteroidetes bacterium]|nr:hypothetical protein [Bacteroidota bacterium]